MSSFPSTSETVQAFVDSSVGFSLFRACERSSLWLVQCVFSRAQWDRGKVVEGICAAAREGNLDIVAWLSEAGNHVARTRMQDVVNAKTCVKSTALHRAGHLDVVKWLSEKGARVTMTDCSGQTAMLHAAENGHLIVVQWLVGKGSVVSQANRRGETALHLAAGNGHLHVVKWHVENGAKLNGKNRLDRTPTHLAAENGQLSVVKYLVDHFLPAFDLDMKDYEQRTALYLAAGRGHITSELWESLFAAAKWDQAHVLEILYEQYCDIICRPNSQGRTPLHCAAAEGELKVVRFLLSHEMAPHQVDTFGIAPCGEACRHRHLHVLRCLLDAGVNINASNLAGRTALHCAADTGFVDIVGELLAYGAKYFTNKSEEVNVGLRYGSNSSQALDSHPGTNNITLKRRKGIFRPAIRTGTPLVPVFVFSESDLYYQVTKTQCTLDNFGSQLIVIGIAQVQFLATDHSGNLLVWMPHRNLPSQCAFACRYGTPIAVPLVTNPSEDDVIKYQKLYQNALENLYKAHEKHYYQEIVPEHLRLESRPVLRVVA
ncbi:unnamed protein product [Phytophthora lilii]|uniref:Unnamed protein product n=1 Tax=Phytophthora lilii TaxID=2077276 RepID=A0A9W6YIX8_9STRA|nr:unnamed protein product [Phytophthora lilii]